MFNVNFEACPSPEIEMFKDVGTSNGQVARTYPAESMISSENVASRCIPLHGGTKHGLKATC